MSRLSLIKMFRNESAETFNKCSKAYELGRADEREKVLDEVKELIETKLVDNFALSDATKYGNITAEQQANSYATVMKYEIADCVDDLLDDLEQLKEKK